MKIYREFIAKDYTAFVHSLLNSKGNHKQRNFLESLREGNQAFLQLIQNKVKTERAEELPIYLKHMTEDKVYNPPQNTENRLHEIGIEGSDELPIYPKRMTEDEFCNPSQITENRLYELWKDLTPNIACRSTFWVYTSYRHIQENIIDAIYLAADRRSKSSAAERIDKVLQDNSANSEKKIDDCVRTVLRNMGGLPEARGNRSIYTDCPFGRTWWRERLVQKICERNKEQAEPVRHVVSYNKQYWETLVNFIVSRNSILGSQEIRDALVLSLAALLEKDKNSPLTKDKKLKIVCRRIGHIQAARELSVLDEEELRELIDEIVENTHELKKLVEDQQSER